MKKVLILLANGFEEYETSAIRDVLGHCKIYSDDNEKIDFQTTALNCEVKSTWGAKIETDIMIKDIKTDDYDALIIPGGFEEDGYYDELFNSKCQDLIIDFNNKNKYLISICVGSIPIAKTGILKGCCATTYCSTRRQKQLENYGVKLKNNKIVMDKKIITSNGPATAIDVAFVTLELLTSKNNSDKIMKLMGFANTDK